MIKSNESIVRETVDKKCIIVFGINEKKEPNETTRDNELKAEMNKVLDMVNEENEDLKDEIEEVYRVGRYKGDSQ